MGQLVDVRSHRRHEIATLGSVPNLIKPSESMGFYMGCALGAIC